MGRSVLAQVEPNWVPAATTLTMYGPSQDQQIVRNVVATLIRALQGETSWADSTPPAFRIQLMSNDPYRVSFHFNRNHPDYDTMLYLSQRAESRLVQLNEVGAVPQWEAAPRGFLLFGGGSSVTRERASSIRDVQRELASYLRNRVSIENGVDYRFVPAASGSTAAEFYLNIASPDLMELLNILRIHEMSLRGRLIGGISANVRFLHVWSYDVIQAIYYGGFDNSAGGFDPRSSFLAALQNGSSIVIDAYFELVESSSVQTSDLGLDSGLISKGDMLLYISIPTNSVPLERLYNRMATITDMSQRAGTSFLSVSRNATSERNMQIATNSFIDRLRHGVVQNSDQAVTSPPATPPEAAPERPDQAHVLADLYVRKPEESNIEVEIRRQFEEGTEGALRNIGIVKDRDYWVSGNEYSGSVSWRPGFAQERMLLDRVLRKDRELSNALRAYRLDPTNRGLLVSLIGQEAADNISRMANSRAVSAIEEIVKDDTGPFESTWGEEFWSENLDAVIEMMDREGALSTFMAASQEDKLKSIRRAVSLIGVIPGYVPGLSSLQWFKAPMETISKSQRSYSLFTDFAEKEGLTVPDSRFELSVLDFGEIDKSYDKLVGLNEMNALKVNDSIARYSYFQMGRGSTRVDATRLQGIIAEMCIYKMCKLAQTLPVFTNTEMANDFVKYFLINNIVGSYMFVLSGALSTSGFDVSIENPERFLVTYSTPDQAMESNFGQALMEIIEDMMYDAMDAFSQTREASAATNRSIQSKGSDNEHLHVKGANLSNSTLPGRTRVIRIRTD